MMHETREKKRERERERARERESERERPNKCPGREWQVGVCRIGGDQPTQPGLQFVMLWNLSRPQCGKTLEGRSPISTGDRATTRPAATNKAPGAGSMRGGASRDWWKFGALGGPRRREASSAGRKEGRQRAAVVVVSKMVVPCMFAGMLVPHVVGLLSSVAGQHWVRT